MGKCKVVDFVAFVVDFVTRPENPLKKNITRNFTTKGKINCGRLCGTCGRNCGHPGFFHPCVGFVHRPEKKIGPLPAKKRKKYPLPTLAISSKWYK